MKFVSAAITNWLSALKQLKEKNESILQPELDRLIQQAQQYQNQASDEELEDFFVKYDAFLLKHGLANVTQETDPTGFKKPKNLSDFLSGKRSMAVAQSEAPSIQQSRAKASNRFTTGLANYYQARGIALPQHLQSSTPSTGTSFATEEQPKFALQTKPKTVFTGAGKTLGGGGAPTGVSRLLVELEKNPKEKTTTSTPSVSSEESQPVSVQSPSEDVFMSSSKRKALDITSTSPSITTEESTFAVKKQKTLLSIEPKSATTKSKKFTPSDVTKWTTVLQQLAMKNDPLLKPDVDQLLTEVKAIGSNMFASYRDRSAFYEKYQTFLQKNGLTEGFSGTIKEYLAGTKTIPELAITFATTKPSQQQQETETETDIFKPTTTKKRAPKREREEVETELKYDFPLWNLDQVEHLKDYINTAVELDLLSNQLYLPQEIIQDKKELKRVLNILPDILESPDDSILAEVDQELETLDENNEIVEGQFRFTDEDLDKDMVALWNYMEDLVAKYDKNHSSSESFEKQTQRLELVETVNFLSENKFSFNPVEQTLVVRILRNRDDYAALAQLSRILIESEQRRDEVDRFIADTLEKQAEKDKEEEEEEEETSDVELVQQQATSSTMKKQKRLIFEKRTTDDAELLRSLNLVVDDLIEFLRGKKAQTIDVVETRNMSQAYETLKSIKLLLRDRLKTNVLTEEQRLLVKEILDPRNLPTDYATQLPRLLELRRLVLELPRVREVYSESGRKSLIFEDVDQLKPLMPSTRVRPIFETTLEKRTSALSKKQRAQLSKPLNLSWRATLLPSWIKLLNELAAAIQSENVKEVKSLLNVLAIRIGSVSGEQKQSYHLDRIKELINSQSQFVADYLECGKYQVPIEGSNEFILLEMNADDQAQVELFEKIVQNWRNLLESSVVTKALDLMIPQQQSSQSTVVPPAAKKRATLERVTVLPTTPFQFVAVTPTAPKPAPEISIKQEVFHTFKEPTPKTSTMIKEELQKKPKKQFIDLTEEEEQTIPELEPSSPELKVVETRTVVLSTPPKITTTTTTTTPSSPVSSFFSSPFAKQHITIGSKSSEVLTPPMQYTGSGGCKEAFEFLRLAYPDHWLQLQNWSANRVSSVMLLNQVNYDDWQRLGLPRSQIDQAIRYLLTHDCHSEWKQYASNRLGRLSEYQTRVRTEAIANELALKFLSTSPDTLRKTIDEHVGAPFQSLLYPQHRLWSARIISEELEPSNDPNKELDPDVYVILDLTFNEQNQIELAVAEIPLEYLSSVERRGQDSLKNLIQTIYGIQLSMFLRQR